MSYLRFLFVALIILIVVVMANRIARNYVEFKFGKVGKEAKTAYMLIDGSSAIILLLLGMFAPIDEILAHPGISTLVYIVAMILLFCFAGSDPSNNSVLILTVTSWIGLPFAMHYLWHDVLLTMFCVIFTIVMGVGGPIALGIASEEQQKEERAEEMYYTYEEKK